MIIKHGGLMVRKGLWAFFLDRALRVLIGWADKVRSRGCVDLRICLARAKVIGDFDGSC